MTSGASSASQKRSSAVGSQVRITTGPRVTRRISARARAVAPLVAVERSRCSEQLALLYARLLAARGTLDNLLAFQLSRERPCVQDEPSDGTVFDSFRHEVEPHAMMLDFIE